MKITQLTDVIFSLESILLTIYVFALKEKTVLIPNSLKLLIKNKVNNKIIQWLIDNKFIILAILYFLILLAISYSLIWILKKEWLIDADEVIRGRTISSFENANDSYLPTYLGYFFVSLSIPSWELFRVLFIILFMLSYRSKFSHFNPLFIFLGYKYYFYELNNTKNLLITKEIIKNPNEIEFDKLVRLNDFTFIDIEQ